MTESAISSNGGARYQTEKVRVAIVGVGNCASSFVQGVEYYKDADPSQAVPGLMHVELGGYHVRDIEFTAAFDIDADKVGKDLSEAIWAGQNNTIKFADVPHLGVPVYRGMTHDGLGKYLKQKIEKAPGETDDIVQILKETKTDVVVSYLPVGSEQATKWYVEQVLEAGCGFVNCIPVFIASENYWANRFRKAGLPIVGDDIKSQVGATILHRTLASLFQDRGVRLARTSQLNVGGNMDFFNMLERERLESKKISKTQAVTSLLDEELPADDVYIGPSDYVPWLTDRKWAHIRLEGEAFGDVPLSFEAKLEVWDSPNSAGIVTDAVRCCKLALNHGLGGPLNEPSSYLMKSPPVQVPDSVAHDDTERFIAQYSGAPKLPGGEARIKVEPTTSGSRVPAGSGRTVPGRILRLVATDRLRIAQVTPYPWEQHHEVNRFVERLSDELCARGHSIVVVAPSDSRELVREGRARIEAQQHDPDAVFAEHGNRLARGRRPEPALPARRVGGASARRVAHAGGLPRAHRARLRARSRAVRSERRLRRAAPLPRPERRELPRRHGAAALDPGGAPGGGAPVRAPGRAHRELHASRASCWSATSPGTIA